MSKNNRGRGSAARANNEVSEVYVARPKLADTYQRIDAAWGRALEALLTGFDWIENEPHSDQRAHRHAVRKVEEQMVALTREARAAAVAAVEAAVVATEKFAETAEQAAAEANGFSTWAAMEAANKYTPKEEEEGAVA